MRRTAGALITVGWLSVSYLLIPPPRSGDSEEWTLWSSALVLTLVGVGLGIRVLRRSEYPSTMVSGWAAFALYAFSRIIADYGFFKLYVQDLLAGRVLEHFGEIASRNTTALITGVYFNFVLTVVLLIAAVMLIVDYRNAKSRIGTP